MLKLLPSNLHTDHKMPGLPIQFLIFELVITHTRRGDFVKLLDVLVCQFAVSFHAFRRMPLQVI